jgi:hypothetical protein
VSDCEPQKEALQLRDDGVLIVPRIPDQRQAGSGRLAWEIFRVWITASNRIALEKRVVAGVEIRLIVRTPSIHVAQGIRVVLLLQTAGGISFELSRPCDGTVARPPSLTVMRFHCQRSSPVSDH